MGSPEVILLVALVMLLVGGRHIATLGRGLGEGIEAFKDALGGGPQSPNHPLPGNDSKILNRRRSRPQSEL
jgi:sec-independent protein translocase protein TatA